MKLLLLALLLALNVSVRAQIVSYTAPNISQIHFYWKIDSVHNATTIQQLIQKEKLVFAMNGGMFRPDYSPVGLYIQNHRLLRSINTASGGGNFGLKPNGVFYITSDNKAVVCKTENPIRHFYRTG